MYRYDGLNRTVSELARIARSINGRAAPNREAIRKRLLNGWLVDEAVETTASTAKRTRGAGSCRTERLMNQFLRRAS